MCLSGYLQVAAESLSINMGILVISLCACHSKNLECSKPVQGLALAHKSVCINWRLHSVCLEFTIELLAWATALFILFVVA